MAPREHIGIRLRYARERLGLTQNDVQEKTSIGGSSLSEFEHAKREPSLSQLTQLAKLYRRPVTFFLEERPLATERVRWRQRPENAADIEAGFLELCQQYHNLETWSDGSATTPLPTAGTTKKRHQAERLASETQRTLGLGDRPAVGLLHVLEEQVGLKVFHLPFDPRGTAACLGHEEFGQGILLNTKNPRWRRNFDLAHELFHLLTWTSDTGSEPSWDDSEEKLADTFAASLLMPATEVRALVDAAKTNGKLSLSSVFDLARHFDVSAEALIWRVHVLYGGTPANNEATMQTVERARRAASTLDERVSDDPPVRPARFRMLAIRALRRGDLSLGRFAQYMGMTRQKAAKYMEQELDDDEAFELPSA